VEGVYELTVMGHFSSAHSLREYEGNCERVHGHNWKVEVSVLCGNLDKRGIGVDFKDLKRTVKNVTDTLDHRDLNTIPPFDVVNPSSENIARYLYDRLCESMPENIRVRKVRVWESESASAAYIPMCGREKREGRSG